MAETGYYELSEQERVEGWRAGRLIEAGYDSETALKIAADTKVDLHFACDLVATRKCPPALAAQIVL